MPTSMDDHRANVAYFERLARERRTSSANSQPLRVEMLHEAAKLTSGDRDLEYGPPAVNMACAGELKAAIRKHATRALSPAEQEALDMVLTKLSRVVTGTPKRDTYVDGAAYFAIAGEIALKAG